MAQRKKSVINSNFSAVLPGDNDLSNNILYKGLGGQQLVQKQLGYHVLPSERFITNKEDNLGRGGGAGILIGADRPAGGPMSDLNKTGEVEAASIRVVAGVGSKLKDSAEDGNLVNPGLTDGAALFLSERSEADRVYQLDGTPSTPSIKDGSMMVGHADSVRFVGDNIRLITNPSRDGKAGIYGIDLIAGNDPSDAQPMVKGNNLVEALRELSSIVEDNRRIMNSYVDSNQKFIADGVSKHTHRSPFYFLNTTPSEEVLPESIENQINVFEGTELSQINQGMNIKNWADKYLGGKHKEKFINSDFNNTN